MYIHSHNVCISLASTYVATWLCGIQALATALARFSTLMYINMHAAKQRTQEREEEFFLSYHTTYMYAHAQL